MEEKNELNGVLARLTQFADGKGGPSKIYNAIGKQVSTYWNLVKNDSKPSVDTLIKFAEVYPDFDMNWILLGKRSGNGEDELSRTKRELAYTQAIVKQLTGYKEDVTASFKTGAIKGPVGWLKNTFCVEQIITDLKGNKYIYAAG